MEKWKRFDLHHHTYEDKGNKCRRGEFKNYQEILDFYNEHDFGLIAITNHDEISNDSYKEYKKYIKEKKYNIEIIMGIELSFYNKDLKKGQLIIIFDENSYKNKKEVIENTLKENYNSKDKPDIDKFIKLINELHSNKIAFLVYPHFHKGANNMDYNFMHDEINDFVLSCDAFEGKTLKVKDIESIEEAFLSIGLEPKENAIFMGSDATNMDDLKKFAIERCNWFLTQQNFKGIAKSFNFPRTRIGLANKKEPFLTKNIINALEIKKEKIKLYPGINVIIGRRGSGKSTLLENIYYKFEKLDFPNEIKKISDFEIIGNDYNKRMKKISQNDLSKTLTKFSNSLEETKENKTDIIKKIFKCEEEGKDFLKEFLDLFNSKIKLNNLICEYFKECLQSKKNYINNQKEKITDNWITQFESEITKAANKEEIDFLRNDLICIEKSLKERNISKWLIYELEEIKLNLEKNKKKEKYKENEKISKIIQNIKIYRKKNSVSQAQEKVKRENSIISELKSKKKKFIKSFKECEVTIGHLSDVFNKLINNKQIVLEEKGSLNDESDFFTYDYVIESFSKEEDFEKFSEFVEIILNKKIVNKGVGNLLSLDINNKEEIKFRSTPVKNDDWSKLFKFDKDFKISGKSIKNLSTGTKHEEFITASLGIIDSDIILLDQPDDNLDAITIDESIILKLIKNYHHKQWIVVTHDPKIILNTDSKKIILADYNREFDEFKNIHSAYTEISEEDIKNWAFKIIDAKKEYPLKRSNLYTRKK